MSNAPPPPREASLPPATTTPASSAPPVPMLPSIVPLSLGGNAGDVHALSLPPGMTITNEPPPPSLTMQLVASLADVAAVLGLVTIVLTHNMAPTTGAGWIVAVLAARAKPVRLGAQAVSGVATLLVSAMGVGRTVKPPPAIPPPA